MLTQQLDALGQTACLDRPAGRRAGQQHQPEIRQYLFDGRHGRQLRQPPSIPLQVLEGILELCRRLSLQAGWDGSVVGERAARPLECVQVRIADSEQTTAKDSDQRHRVVRPGDRIQAGVEQPQLADFVQGCAAGNLTRDAQLLQLLAVDAEVALVASDDQEVPGRRPRFGSPFLLLRRTWHRVGAGNRGVDRPGHQIGFVQNDVALVAVVSRHLQHAEPRQISRVAIRTTNQHGPFGGCVDRGCIGEYIVERPVDPFDQRTNRAEVGREGYDSPPISLDDSADLVVGSDVGTAEAVDRLLGIADDKQRAGYRSTFVPVGPRRAFGSE